MKAALSVSGAYRAPAYVALAFTATWPYVYAAQLVSSMRPADEPMLRAMERLKGLSWGLQRTSTWTTWS